MSVNLCKLILLASAFALFGCAMTSSGNFVGEAGALKYSTEGKKYRFAETGVSFGATNRNMETEHHETEIAGGSIHLRVSLFSFDYLLFGQKGGLFLSVPVSVPMDVGVRPSLVQWVGPFYAGAGVSFVGGFYPNMQDDEKSDANDSWGRFDGFVLPSIGGGLLFDITDKLALGGYVTWERLAFNSGGDMVEHYGFHLNVLGDEGDDEVLPPYSYRKMVATIGVQAFLRFKFPLGFYGEYSSGDLFENDGVWKVKTGAVLFY